MSISFFIHEFEFCGFFFKYNISLVLNFYLKWNIESVIIKINYFLP